jgi:hypothetical protein
LALSCKDYAKNIVKTQYENSQTAKLEILTPDIVIAEKFGIDGEIVSPKVYSPRQLEYKTLLPQKDLCIQVLRELLTSEKVARRQYDETMMFSLFPDLRQYQPELLYIRNDEYEHEKILECIIQRLQSPGAVPKPINWNEPHATAKLLKRYGPEAGAAMETAKGVMLTPKGLGELYVTMLDRFQEIEQKAVSSYEEFLVTVQQSKAALEKSDLPNEKYYEIVTPLNKLEQKVNKHLNEERTHLDVVNAMRDMFNRMKSGNVY